jgi:hypothetical protein
MRHDKERWRDQLRHSSKGVHNAGRLTFEGTISYPFHPLVGQSVLVIGETAHAATLSSESKMMDQGFCSLS